jgi:cobalt-zinc-cadmium efflux system protein
LQLAPGHDHPAHAHGHDHAHHHGGAHDHGQAHTSADHTHRHAPANFDRAFGIGITLNLAFVAIEAFFGWRVDSLALLADAGHNLSDVAALVLAWVAALAGRRRASARYTYGFKRASILAACANALLLLVAMGSLAWEAASRLQSPQATDAVTVMAVAGLGIVVNGATALLFMRGREHDLNIRGAYLHMAGDTLVSAGVVAAGALTLWWGWTWLDPATSLAIAFVIVWSSWRLLRESTRLLFDGVPEHIALPAVRDYLAALPGVTEVCDLHVWAIGTEQVAMTAHLVVQSGQGGDAFLRSATQGLQSRFRIAHVTLQLMDKPLPEGACHE